MNCQDFNNVINELADYKPMPATLRDESVSHAALCPDCAANLAAARNVRRQLLQAARAESETAPARVKAQLLAAFAQSALVESPKSKVQSQRQDTVADIGHWTSDIGRRRRWFAAATAIAAVVLLVVIFPLIRRALTPVSQPNNDLIAVSKNTPASSSAPAPSSLSSSGGNRSGADKSIVEGVTSKEPPAAAPKLATNKLRSAKRRDATSAHSAYKSVARNNGEYLPLTYLTKGTAMESGTVVRVELSRTALASLGFTSSVDNSTESVKAEVILGDDGVARAIRLVE